MKTYLDLVAEAKPRITEVPLAQAEQAIAASDLLVDVREEGEYAAGHLPGAVHMSRGLVEAKLTMNPAYQRADLGIVLYCRSDARATLVADVLQRMGYTSVRVISGGFDAWVQAGKPIQR